MADTIHRYYIDEPLSDDEAAYVVECLSEREGASGEFVLEQVRVPTVWPAPPFANQIAQHTNLAKNNLRSAGVLRDYGRQVVFVMPKEFYWGGLCMMALWELIGHFPYAVQPWSQSEDGAPQRGPCSLINIDGLMRGD